MIKGIQAALDELAKLEQSARGAMKRGELTVATRIVNDAKAAAPVDVGNLQAGIYAEQTDSSTVIVGGDKIAAYQEFGTGPLVSIPDGLEPDARQFFVNGKGHTPPHPFFFPACFRHQEEIIPEIEKELQNIGK